MISLPRSISVSKKINSSLPNRLPGSVNPAEIQPALTKALVSWFKKAARDLPWRHSNDAYRIWVSEVMLQQTQVKTVIAYFHRFLARFPTVNDLAHAPEEHVLHAWEGLGYYRRARALHRAAQSLVQAGHQNLPPDPSLLATLPGMGEYTRNAVLSQAHAMPLPIVEANSQRVLARILGVKDDPSRGPVKKWLWQSAAQLVCHKNPGTYNQALMELGALICTPQKPACLVCPARPWCAAAASGDPESLPLKSVRAQITKVSEICLACSQGPQQSRRWLLLRRPASASRWAGLWEFPHCEVPESVTPGKTMLDLAQSLFQAPLAATTTTLGRVKHAITRYQVEMQVEVAHLKNQLQPTSLNHDQHQWFTAPQIVQLPLSAPQRRVWKLLSNLSE